MPSLQAEYVIQLKNKVITFALEINSMKLLHNHCVGNHLKFSNISLLMNTDQQKV